MPALLDRMNRQMTEAQDRYRALETLIAEDDRDPSDIERGEMDHLRATMERLAPQIVDSVELERRLNTSSDALNSLPHAPVPARPRTPTPVASPVEAYRSMGEFAMAVANGAVDREAREAVEALALNYQIEHARALVDVTTADVAGIVPPIWIRTFADTISVAQPFVEAFSQMPLPDAGMTLTYPKIVTRPLVGKQTAEKTDIPSRKVSITSATAAVVTYGGGEDVSVQVIQRTDPAYLGLMLELYAEQMAIVTDTDAIAAAIGAVTLAPVSIGTDPKLWGTNLANVIKTVLTQSRVMPDTFVMSTDMWAKFAGASDADGRPLFPNASPANPMGQTSFNSVNGDVRGLNFVVDPNMTTDRGIIGSRAFFTSLLGPVQTLSADNVSKLGVDYAVFRFASFISRRPDAAAIVKTGP